MTKTFKIKPCRISHVALNDLKKQGSVYVITNLALYSYMLLLTRNADFPTFIFTIAISLSLIFEFGFLLYLYKFKLLYYSKYVILTDDNLLCLKNDLKESEIREGLIKYGWSQSKLIFNQTNIRIRWEDIKNFKRKKNGILVFSASGKQRIFVPYDLEDFHALEILLNTKRENHLKNCPKQAFPK